MSALKDPVSAAGIIGSNLTAWLDANADDLNASAANSEAVMPALASAGLFEIGVPSSLGGSGGDVRNATLAIAEVAEHSLTAAFIFWGQRTFIEYLLQSPNKSLSDRWLARLISGKHAGATGLSNAMKFLGGIEALQIEASPEAEGLRLRGKLAWITNLRKAGFVAAAAVAPADDGAPMVVSFSGDLPAVERSADLDLIALRGSNTAAVKLDNVLITRGDIIHEDARAYLPAVRPAFLSMQCGMSIGLARASLHAATTASAMKQNILTPRITHLSEALAGATAALLEGVADRRFETRAAPLFRLRIKLAEIAQEALNLELQAKGGLAYLNGSENSFARRWSEAAFIPIITPSLTQLQTALAIQESDSREQSL